MARMSKEARAELERQLAEDDAADDDTDEVEVGQKDGSYFKGTFRRALELGLVTRPAPKPDPKDKGEGGEVKRFTGGRRTS